MLQWRLTGICLFELVFLFSSDKDPEVELLDHLVALFLTLWGNATQFSIVAAPIYIPTNTAQGFPFLDICCFLFLISTDLTGWGDASQWFWSACPWWSVTMEQLSLCLVCISSLGKCWSSAHILIGAFVCFLMLSCRSSLDINPWSNIQFTNIFSHSVGCLFVLLASSKT